MNATATLTRDSETEVEVETRSSQHELAPTHHCRDCGVPLTKGLLINNSVWISPIPPQRTIARRLDMWLLGSHFEKRKVNAWRCGACGRLELIAK